MRSGGGVWRVAERAELTALRAAGNDIGLIWMQTLLRLREDCSAAKGGLGIVCPSIVRMAAYSNSVCRTWVWIGDKVCKHGGSRQKLTHEREATRRMLDLRVSAVSAVLCMYMEMSLESLLAASRCLGHSFSLHWFLKQLHGDFLEISSY